MPPRAFLVLNNGGDVNLARMHSTYFQNLIDMERDFKKTPLLLYRHSDSSGDVDYVSNPSASVTDYSLKSELTRILQGGFVDNYTTSFKAIDLRIKGGTNFTQCAANGYHPNTVDVPCILMSLFLLGGSPWMTSISCQNMLPDFPYHTILVIPIP